jgi:transposase
MHELILIPDCRIAEVMRAGPGRLHVAVQPTAVEASCPVCHTLSQAVHSWYRRHPADLPSLGSEVHLELSVRRFYCRNTLCRRRTFAEPLPTLVAPRARRTRRLAGAQGAVGVTCGGEAGARLLKHLAMATSGDTVLRLVRAMPLPESPMPRVLGVDDWARRKGHTYGTILVDLETRRVADLLPERTAESLAAWLKDRGPIEVITRDRSSEYARGAAMGAPNAVQVTDRWHLLQNLREMIERWLTGIHSRLRRLPPVETSEAATPRRIPARRRTSSEAARSAGSRARRLAQYEEVKQRFGAGETVLAISRAMALSRDLVRRYAYAESFPERSARVPGPSVLDPYSDYLEARVAGGCENAMTLWRDLKELGYTGSAKPVRRWLRHRRTTAASSSLHQDLCGFPTASATATIEMPAPLLSARKLAPLLMQSPEALDASASATLARIAQDRDVAGVLALARRFAELVRSCGIHRDKAPADPSAVFGTWLEEAQSCGVPAVETFAIGLQKDEAAIRAALTMPWSSGQAEGQINKLKLIKRQMYGRANFDLLRRRVLLAA